MVPRFALAYHPSGVADYSELEAVLGYPFKDRGLLEQALRHASWCNEQQPAERVDDNERFEFLGDAVLDLVVGHRLMTRYPQLREGELSVTRAQVVSEAGLSEVAGQLGIGRWLLLGKGEEKSGRRSKPSILEHKKWWWPLKIEFVQARIIRAPIDFSSLPAHKGLVFDEAAGKLKGTPNSQVRLELSGLSAADHRTINVTRRAVQVKSIPVVKIVDASRGIGYIQMTGFQKSSPAELDDALARLNRQGMRLLIWDLRGNPGGLLTAAVEVLDRFIDNGVLVSTKGRTADQNWSYSAHRPNSSNVPIVLLTDENSASASEIVAGAIRDHQRGTIVGRKTYGKWSVQSIFPVQRNVGLRLTTAKFYSPAGKTLGKIGVKPDVEVDLPDHVVLHRGPMANSLEDDPDIRKALDVARDQLDGRKLFSNRATD